MERLDSNYILNAIFTSGGTVDVREDSNFILNTVFDADNNALKVGLSGDISIGSISATTFYSGGTELSTLFGGTQNIDRLVETLYVNDTLKSVYTSGCTASGIFSHAEGHETTASNHSAHAEGAATEATGFYSHAEGAMSKAYANYSHAEGYITTASGGHSHSEGSSTEAIGLGSHSEGSDTRAFGDYSHAEGRYTSASGKSSHSEGAYNKTYADFSHIAGSGNTLGLTAVGSAIIADHDVTTDTPWTLHTKNLKVAESISATTIYSGSTNINSLFLTTEAHVGDVVSVSAGDANIEVGGTAADPTVSLADSLSLNGITASGTTESAVYTSGGTDLYSIFLTTEAHVGDVTSVTADDANIEIGGTGAAPTVGLADNVGVVNLSAATFYSGSTELSTLFGGGDLDKLMETLYVDDTIKSVYQSGNTVTGFKSVAFGTENINSSTNAYVEGQKNTCNANSTNSHTEGVENISSETNSHTEGYKNNNSVAYGHIEGKENVAAYSLHHIEGSNNYVVGYDCFHVEGKYHSINAGSITHVEGQRHNAHNATISHVEGQYNVVNTDNFSHIEGQYNTAINSDSCHVGGSGNTVSGYISFIGGSQNSVASGNGITILSSNATTGTTDYTLYADNIAVKNSISATTFYSGSTELGSLFGTVTSVSTGDGNVTIGGTATDPTVAIADSPSFNAITASGLTTTSTLKVDGLADSTERFLSTTDGNVAATYEAVDIVGVMSAYTGDLSAVNISATTAIYIGSTSIASTFEYAVSTEAVTGATVTGAINKCYLANATAASITINLPAAASSTNKSIYVKKTDSSVNTVTLDGNASETIDGALTYVIGAQYDFVRVVCDGSNWFIIGS